MSGVAGRAGPKQERPDDIKRPDASIRVSDAVRRQLLTIQYERKMAGEWVSFSEIIAQLLDRAGAA